MLLCNLVIEDVDKQESRLNLLLLLPSFPLYENCKVVDEDDRSAQIHPFEHALSPLETACFLPFTFFFNFSNHHTQLPFSSLSHADRIWLDLQKSFHASYPRHRQQSSHRHSPSSPFRPSKFNWNILAIWIQQMTVDPIGSSSLVSKVCSSTRYWRRKVGWRRRSRPKFSSIPYYACARLLSHPIPSQCKNRGENIRFISP